MIPRNPLWTMAGVALVAAFATPALAGDVSFGISFGGRSCGVRAYYGGGPAYHYAPTRYYRHAPRYYYRSHSYGYYPRYSHRSGHYRRYSSPRRYYYGGHSYARRGHGRHYYRYSPGSQGAWRSSRAAKRNRRTKTRRGVPSM